MEPIAVIIGAVLLGAYGYRRPMELLRIGMRARLRAQGLRRDRVTLADAEVAYWRGGTGTPVVFVHGFGTEAAVNWHAQLLACASDFDVIAPDLPGFGASQCRPDANDIAFQVRCLRALLDHLRLERVALVGHSLGGWISLAFATTFPERVERLVLVDAAGLRFDPDLTMERALLPQSVDDVRLLIRVNFRRRMRVPTFVLRDLLRVARLDVVSRTALLQRLVYGDEHIDDHLHRITAPTLIVWGRHDAITPPALGERLARAIPDAQLVIFEESAHSPNVEQSRPFNRLVREFLRRASAADAADVERGAVGCPPDRDFRGPDGPLGLTASR